MAISCGRRSVSETSSGAGTTSGSKRMLGPRSFNRAAGRPGESLNYALLRRPDAHVRFYSQMAYSKARGAR
jgi:hypothetical protein